MLNVTGDENLKDTLGKIQPFRYRGYVYDEETGVYYLRSRYYNAEFGRFSTPDMIIWWDSYKYCNNNPCRFCDMTGTIPVEVDGNSTEEDFLEIYESTYEKAYEKDSKYSTFSVSEYESTISKVQQYVFSGIMLAISTVFGQYHVAAGVAIGAVTTAATIEDPSWQSGTHKHYVVTQTQEYWENVESGNYHGYKTYEPQKFFRMKTEVYILYNDQLLFESRVEYDSYLLYSYRDRIQ